MPIEKKKQVLKILRNILIYILFSKINKKIKKKLTVFQKTVLNNNTLNKNNTFIKIKLVSTLSVIKNAPTYACLSYYYSLKEPKRSLILKSYKLNVL